MNADHETTELAAWGLPLDEIERLGQRLGSFYERFRRHLRTTTRDTSAYGLAYLSGLLRLDTERTMANIGRQTGVEPQNMQHFISNSPWAAAVCSGPFETRSSAIPPFKMTPYWC